LREKLDRFDWRWRGDARTGGNSRDKTGEGEEEEKKVKMHFW